MRHSEASVTLGRDPRVASADAGPCFRGYFRKRTEPKCTQGVPLRLSIVAERVEVECNIMFT
jgi:hypothetical protein